MKTRTRYYTVGEIADLLGVQTWRLRRLYERGLLEEPARVGTNRVVTEEEVPKIEQALREAGYMK